MNDQTARWLPIQEAADRHDRGYYQLYRWYQRGYVRCRKVGGRVQISVADLVDFLRPIGRG